MSQDNTKVTVIAIATVVVLAVPLLTYFFLPTSSSPTSAAIIDARIKPVVTLGDIRGTSSDNTQPAATTQIAATPKSAKALYNSACAACHLTGVAGAPIVGNKDAWVARVATGPDNLFNSAKNGKGAMPPKGGSSYSDEELKKAIDFMLTETGLN